MTPRLMREPLRVAGGSLIRCQSDERLVELVRTGSAPAFEAIVDRYGPSLTRYCRRLLSPARAEDAVQQTFVNAYSAICRDDSRIDLRPWLYRIARNAALNALTRDREWSSPRVADLPEATDSVHEEVERRLQLRDAIQAVQTLPERQRDAIVLRELEGRSYEQIASELDVTGGAVRQLLSRARETLRSAASALTPIGLLGRLRPESQPVLTRVAEAAANPAVPASVYRGIAAAVAGAVLVGGLAEGGPQTARPAELPPGVSHAVGSPVGGVPAPVRPGRSVSAAGSGVVLMPSRSGGSLTGGISETAAGPAAVGRADPGGSRAAQGGGATAPPVSDVELRGSPDLAAASSLAGVAIVLGPASGSLPSAFSSPIAGPDAGEATHGGGQMLRAAKPLPGPEPVGAPAPAEGQDPAPAPAEDQDPAPAPGRAPDGP